MKAAKGGEGVAGVTVLEGAQSGHANRWETKRGGGGPVKDAILTLSEVAG